MTLKSIEKLRESLKDCTSEAGVEPNRFDTYWIAARACDMLIDEVESEIAERYMQLPVDADGVPIHINDRMENDERVARIVLSDGEYEPSVYLEKLSRPRVLHEYFCHEISHFNPRTVEDVLRDLVDGIDSVEFDALTAIDGAAAEIRELLGGGGR